MRSIGRGTIALVACVAALSLGGCTEAHREGLKAEHAREAYKSDFGARYVASVVGSAMPGGNPSALHAIGMDLAWRSSIGRLFEMSGLAPSPFDAVDPNRPVQFRKINETTTEIIFR